MIRKALITLLTSLTLAGFLTQTALAAVTGFQAGHIIDDAIFTNTSSMSVDQIQTFLNSKVPICDTNGTQMLNATQTRAQYAATINQYPPFTCLKDYSENSLSAAQIIYNTAQQYHINPQVLIVLLQKEQGLVTDSWPYASQYQKATGYGCPDTAPCNTAYYGFTNQLTKAANMFRKILDNSPDWYTPYVLGNNYILYSPNTACGGSMVNIENRATQALYNYTPYQPNQASLDAGWGTATCGSYGNRNFYSYFTSWFGSTLGLPDYSCKTGSNLSEFGSGEKVVKNQYTVDGYAKLTLSLLNNTGSKCIETHTWGDNEQSWITNVASGHPAVNPLDGEIVSANIYGDSRDELIFIKYANTGSGNIEVHTLYSDYQRWLSNIATNHPSVSHADDEVIAADTNGDGVDELLFIKYRNNGSGKIEIHTWAPGYQSWISNIATNYPAIDPAEGRVIAGDMNGDGKDEVMFIKYMNTGSGKIEVHTWAPGYQSWANHIATNHPSMSPTDSQVLAANLYGNRADELVFVKYRNTGSGKIEVHTWAPGYQSWISNIATNLSQFQ